MNLQKVPKQVTAYIKGPSDIMQTQLWLTPNSQHNCLCRALHATVSDTTIAATNIVSATAAITAANRSFL